MSSYVFELLPNLKRLDLHVAGAECGEKLNCSVTQDSILFLTPEGDCDVLQLPFPHSRGEHELSRADSETLTIRFPLQTTPGGSRCSITTSLHSHLPHRNGTSSHAHPPPFSSFPDASPFIGHTLSELSAPRLEELGKSFLYLDSCWCGQRSAAHPPLHPSAFRLDVKQMRALACRVCGAVLTENPPQQIFSLPSLHWRDWASELWFCHPPQEHTAKVNARTKFVLKPGTWMIGNTEIHTLREECRAVTGNLSAESKSEAGQPHPPEEEEEEEEEEPYLKCPECSAIVGVLVPEIDSLDSHPRSGCGSDPGKDDSESKQAGTAGRKQKTETEEEKYRAGLWKHCVGILPDDLYQNLSVETYIAQRIIAMTEVGFAVEDSEISFRCREFS